ncbi:zinc ribbon domain-containing protein [SAR202 cluster bacterium AC-647-N09_OGT_505m]|nr:zinc ribbon domain-containing protein [SAR202 cluster bacterium AC-647-N09_OGT_505m]
METKTANGRGGGQVPIYEYECLNCNHKFELKQGFDAEPTESCPLCQSLSRRKFHAPAVIYKGSGFYTTDYARRNQPSDNGDSGSDVATSTKETSKETSSKED